MLQILAIVSFIFIIVVVWFYRKMSAFFYETKDSVNRLTEQAHKMEAYRSRKELQTSNWRITPASPARSVLFLHNSYYHFYYLAKALRQRGWDAITISYEDPLHGLNRNYYHGEDVNIYSPDPMVFRQNIEELFADATRRFDLLHFAGDRLMSFFPELWREEHPRDIVLWRSLGKKVAYTISGCLSCVSQSTFATWSGLDQGKAACDKCIWQDRPEICSNETNLEWGRKVERYVDLIFAETAPALDFLDSPKTIFDPVTMCLDPELWSPDLAIPDTHRVERKDNEILLFHAVGNYERRTARDGRNIKGTHAIVGAIKRLQSEGFPVRLMFKSDVTNIEIRYLQAQSDIIIDQLNVGCYGATSREGMMLGKPVICYINKCGKYYPGRMNWLDEVPVVSASEESIYGVLKNLVVDKTKRIAIGGRSREYAMKWHGADRCAERYEQVYDELMAR